MRPSNRGFNVAVAREALGRHALRTSLSVLGIVLGIAAVIATMSVSEGATREVMAQVEELGVDNLVARTRATGLSGPTGLVVDDAARVRRELPGALAATPLVQRYMQVARRGRGDLTAVIGVQPAFGDIVGLRTANGRFLAGVDDHAGSRVCVLGAALARKLFGFDAPIGEAIRIGDDHYRVIGVLAARDQAPGGGTPLAWRDLSLGVLVPLASLSGRSVQIAPGQPADEIWLRLAPGGDARAAAPLFERILARSRPTPPFSVVVPEELMAQRQRTQRTFAVVVGSVAALALLVGGIGVMNMLLTSVVERTREIGLRRVAGATRRDVTVQFLTEALLMTIGGGIAGVALGAAVSLAITAYAGWSTHVSGSSVVLGVSVSVLVGLASGLYPAMRAARLEPVDAVRFE